MVDQNPIPVRSTRNPLVFFINRTGLFHFPLSLTLRAPATSALTMLDLNSTMAIDNKKTKKKKSTSKPSETLENENAKSRKILLRSIAAFLEINGFNKTLYMLRSQAQIVSDDLNASSIGIEDLLCKFLESSKGHEEAAIDWRKETGNLQESGGKEKARIQI